MNIKLKNITSQITNMHYLEVIDWLKDKSEDCEHEVLCSIQFFEDLGEDNDELRSKVSEKVKEIIEYNEK